MAELDRKRRALADAMKKSGRWDASYPGEIARMPEPVVDHLLDHYAGTTLPRYVW